MQVVTLVAVLCSLSFFNGVQSFAWIGMGKCPDKVKPLQNFDLTKYAGRWFEISRGGILYEYNGACIQSKYTPNQDGKVDVKIAMIDKEYNRLKTIVGKASLKDNSGVGAFVVTVPNGNGENTLNWSVLDTDYENYAVVYSCVNMQIMYREEAWVLSREAELSNANRTKAEQVLDVYHLYTNSPTVQDCGVIV